MEIALKFNIQRFLYLEVYDRTSSCVVCEVFCRPVALLANCTLAMENTVAVLAKNAVVVAVVVVVVVVVERPAFVRPVVAPPAAAIAATAPVLQCPRVSAYPLDQAGKPSPETPVCAVV